MKQIYFFITCLLLMAAGHAEKSPRANAVKIAAQGRVQIKFSNLGSTDAQQDSVLVIFDRFNHTGAGVVYKVYAIDKDRTIDIEGVPVGKYYVSIQGLGIHRDRVERVVWVSTRRDGKMSISLEDSEAFAKEKVVIPVYAPRFEQMAVLKTN